MTSAAAEPATVHASGSSLVSVITIFLDARRFIADSIESVIAQTWPRWELLLIDDGSTDGSRAIAESFREKMPDRIRILEHSGHENRGMSASRNLGLAAARGRYVAFLDADDVYLSNRLARHVELLDDHPEADVVQSRIDYWRSWQTSAKRRLPDLPEPLLPIHAGVPIAPPELFLLLLESHGSTMPGTASLTFRRSALQRVGGSEEHFRSYYEDQVLCAKLYLSTCVIVINDRLSKYRQHPDSAMARAAADRALPHRWYAGRGEFLAWLEQWLVERKVEDELVWNSLRRAQRDHARSGLPEKRVRPLAALPRVIETLLPASLARRLFDWHGRRKLARAARHTARVHARISTELRARNAPRPGDPRDGN